MLNFIACSCASFTNRNTLFFLTEGPCVSRLVDCWGTNPSRTGSDENRQTKVFFPLFASFLRSTPALTCCVDNSLEVFSSKEQASLTIQLSRATSTAEAVGRRLSRDLDSKSTRGSLPSVHSCNLPRIHLALPPLAVSSHGSRREVALRWPSIFS